MATDDDDKETRATGFNPKRRLCPDGACIGVIGADDKCTVCGTSDGGGSTMPAQAESSPSGDDLLTDDDVASDDEPESPQADREEQGGFDSKRRLCSDGSCIGVVGGDNRCSVCGKPADG